MIVVAGVVIFLGIFLLVASTVGLLRLPDFFTRAHAVAKSETLGLLLVFGGLMLLPQTDIEVAARLVLILVFSVLANPTAVHAVARAARRSGLEPWTRGDAP